MIPFLALVIVSIVVANAIAETTIFVNGQPIRADVIETNGTVYVPVDAIARALGAEVTIKKDAVRISNPAPAPAPVATQVPPPPPATPVAPPPKPWVEPTPSPAFTAIHGRLTWQEN